MSAPLKEGDLLAGKYRVEKVLGEGGMGIVVAAHHIALDEKVAIKLLLPDALSNPEAVSRFGREARAAVKIKNEHVARVIDVGTLESGAPYMVMEYLDGSDLGDWIKQHGIMPVEQAVEFLLQACEAIAEAHGAGIVHRDIKPANLFVIRRADGLLSVKVLDFGISKITPRGSGLDLGYTKTHTVMGSPLYMSPEQMESTRDVDTRTDVWALGVVLYELLTGNLPFLAESMPELVARILKSPPVPMSTYRADTPVGLEEVIQKCLEKNREARYPNVAMLAQALLQFGPKRGRVHVDRITRTIVNAGISASSLDVPASVESMAPPAPPGPGHATKASWGSTAGSGGPNRTRVGLYAAGGLALVAIGAVALAHSSRPRPVAEPTIATIAAPAAPSPTAEPSVVHPPEPAIAVVPASVQVAPLGASSAATAAPAATAATAATRPKVNKATPAKAGAPPAAAPAPAAAPKPKSGHLYDDRE